MENEINGFWDAASEDVKKAYGRAYIDALIEGVRGQGQTYAPTLDPVIDAMDDAVTNERPNDRYLIDGSDKPLDRYCVSMETIANFGGRWVWPTRQSQIRLQTSSQVQGTL